MMDNTKHNIKHNMHASNEYLHSYIFMTWLWRIAVSSVSQYTYNSHIIRIQYEFNEFRMRTRLFPMIRYSTCIILIVCYTPE